MARFRQAIHDKGTTFEMEDSMDDVAEVDSQIEGGTSTGPLLSESSP